MVIRGARARERIKINGAIPPPDSAPPPGAERWQAARAAQTVVVEGVGGDAVDRVAEGLLVRHDPSCLAGSGDSHHS